MSRNSEFVADIDRQSRDRGGEGGRCSKKKNTVNYFRLRENVSPLNILSLSLSFPLEGCPKLFKNPFNTPREEFPPALPLRNEQLSQLNSQLDGAEVLSIPREDRGTSRRQRRWIPLRCFRTRLLRDESQSEHQRRGRGRGDVVSQ